jgi:hypothetical protein
MIRTATACGLLTRLATALALSHAALAGEGVVRILDRPSLPAFGSLQQAIDLAIDGETLVVGDGEYRGFRIDNRKLAIVAAPGASAIVTGTVRVENIGPQRSLVLAGLEFRGESVTTFSTQAATPGVWIGNSAGGVWLVNCTARGGEGAPPTGGQFYGAGGAAVIVEASDRVAFARCMLIGGLGGDDPDPNAYDTYGGAGGAGVRALSANLALYSTTVLGGDGGRGGSRGGDGATAIQLVASGLYVGAGHATGGDGGRTIDFIVFDGANGGHGVDADANSQARFVDTALAGGDAGPCSACSVDGLPGSPTFGTGLFISYAGAARVFSAARVLGDGELWSVQATGAPGDEVFVTEDDKPTFSASQPVLGVTLVPPPPNLRPFRVGAIPASGVLNANVRLPLLASGQDARTRFAQGLVIDAAGQRWPSTPLVRVQLDSDGGADCNGNGRNDVLEVLAGAAPDTDRDLAPDVCALDCNLNGVSDVLDTNTQASADRDNDLVPDECELAATWYVDDDAAQGGDGAPATPFRSLRPAVAAALPGDTLLLSSGLYQRSEDREVETRGKDLTIESQNGAAVTVLDLGGAGRALRIREGGVVTVEGLTFRNGATAFSALEPDAALPGGAILADSGVLNVRDCVFEDNAAAQGGGAIYLRGGRIERCRFARNVATGAATSGGALIVMPPYDQPSVFTALDCEFAGNQADRGGALQLGPLAATFDGCRFVANIAATRGGAIESFGGSNTSLSLLLANSLFAGNIAGEGGVLALTTTSLPLGVVRLQNATLTGNRATVSRGAGLLIQGRAELYMANTIQRGDVSTLGRPNSLQSIFGTVEAFVERCDLEGGPLAFHAPGATIVNYGPSNFDLDPLFADPDGPDGDPATFDDNDYRLAPASPCVDAGAADLLAADLGDRDGDGDTLELLPLDLDGAPRRVDDPAVADTGSGPAPALDLGAYERQP